MKANATLLRNLKISAEGVLVSIVLGRDEQVQEKETVQFEKQGGENLIYPETEQLHGMDRNLEKWAFDSSCAG